MKANYSIVFSLAVIIGIQLQLATAQNTCTSDADCEAYPMWGLVCLDGKCGCKTSLDCLEEWGGICNQATDTCIECLEDSDCIGSDYGSACISQEYGCGCRDDQDCSFPYIACSQNLQLCRECTSDDYCAKSEFGTVCIDEMYGCGCNSDNDCQSEYANTPACNSKSLCQACYNEDDCADNRYGEACIEFDFGCGCNDGGDCDHAGSDGPICADDVCGYGLGVSTVNLKDKPMPPTKRTLMK